MAKHTKISNCRFRSSECPPGAGTDGIVLVIVMMVATLLLIALTVVLPSVYQDGQREREAELIFRGTQYARAVALFHQKFNRYPVNTKELLSTSGMRFLRKEFRDPMDPKGVWRFIHVNASGVLLDSVNQRSVANQTNPAGVGASNSGSTNSMSGGNLSFGGAGATGLQGNSNPMGLQGNSNPMGLQGAGTVAGTNPTAAGSEQIGPTSSFFGNQNQIQGAFIAGVAATSRHESIRIWEKHHHYNEWEFIGLDLGVFGIQVGLPGGSSGPTGVGQQPTTQGSGFSLNSPGSTVSPANSGPPPN